jgi:hypothetical protein
MYNLHFNILKNYLDSIIINNGILEVENPEKIVEKVKLDFLIKLAFRFYKKLYDGEVDSNFFEESKNINNDVVEFYKSEKGLEGHFPRKDNKAELVCLNCNKHFHTTEIPKNNNFLPLCSECEKTIGQEIEIWQKLFD